jgi:galactokinase
MCFVRAMIRLFVPGRLCLFGEHSDWAGALRQGDEAIAPGACILTGTNQGLRATAEAAAAFEISSCLPNGTRCGPLTLAMEDDVLAAGARAPGFFSYAAGVAAEVRRRHAVGGVRIAVTSTDLPIARGLSSSAAISVLTARAFNQVYRLGLDVRAEMELAYRGELATGSQCGRMDQACAYGPRVVQLRIDGPSMQVDTIPVSRPIHLVIVDLQHAKDTRRILADLNRVFADAGDVRHARLRAALGSANLDLVARARTALEQGDAAALGTLMQSAQDRFDRDVAPACPGELAAPRLRALLRDELVRAHAWGGKGVGSQGDGAAQLVCRDADAQAELIRALPNRASVDCLSLTVGAEGAGGWSESLEPSESSEGTEK